MKDPAKIPIILKRLRRTWQMAQGMRFIQLSFNLQANYSHKNNKYWAS